MEKQKLKERKIKQKSHITLHTSHNSGITLVALIITIIVLLILAVVAIRAVQGDGIITKAKEAKSKTTVAQEQEQILLAVNEWKIQKNYQNEPGSFKSFMGEKIANVDSVGGPDAGPLTVTMKDSGNVYTVKDDGTLLIGECWVDNGYGTLIKGSETVEIGKTYTKEQFQEKLREKGKTYTGSYAGDWQVIGAEGDKLKLVSTTNVNNNVALGKTGENVYKTDEAGNPILDEEGNKILKEEIVDSNGDGDLKLEKAAWSYAYSVDTLDKVAQHETGITSARSITIDDIYDIIGEENVDKSSNSGYGKTYKYYCDDTTSGQVYSTSQKNADGSWKTGSKAYHQTFTYTNSKKETVTIGTLADGTTINKGEVELPNNNFAYTLDPETQKPAIGSLETGSYWLASLCVDCNSHRADFNVHTMNSGRISNTNLFCSDGAAYSSGCGVRAVVSI